MSDQPAAGWYVDPTRRFEHRYWDGSTWTEHVSRNGQATTDPLDGGGPASSLDPASEPTHASATAAMGSTAGTGTGGASWEARTGGGSPWEAQARSGTRTNTKAIVSLVLSIIWFGGLASVAAIIVGVMAKREIGERPDEGGAGVATAGIVIGIIGVVGAAFMLLAALALFTTGSTMEFSVPALG